MSDTSRRGKPKKKRTKRIEPDLTLVATDLLRKRRQKQRTKEKVACAKPNKTEEQKLLDKYAVFSSHVNKEGTVLCVVAHLTSPVQYNGARTILAEVAGLSSIQSVYTTLPDFHEFYLGNGFHPAILHPAYKYHVN